MLYLKAGNMEYQASVTGKEIDRDWDGRASKTVTLQMTYAEAAQLFTDGLVWSVVEKQPDEAGAEQTVRETDCSEYCVAGPITDYRDGSIAVKMGTRTEEEQAEQGKLAAERTAAALMGVKTYAAVDAEKAKTLRAAIETASAKLDDKDASTAPELFPQLKGDGSLVKSGTRICWQGGIKRAAVDLWDTAENTPELAPTLWEDISYRQGYRIIPETITAGLAFAKGEKGWWGDELYESLLEANVWTPEANPSGWAKAEM